MARDSNYIISKLESYGVSSSDAYILAAVGYAESSYQTGVIGDKQYGYSVGIFQINLPAHADKLQSWTGSSNRDVWISWLSNLDNNIYAGAEVYKSQGLGAWTMYRNGGYRQYLGQNNTVTFGGGEETNGQSNAVNNFVTLVRAQIGKPYVWGAAGPDSFDCSGLVYWIWGETGAQISRTADIQWKECSEVNSSQLQVGDLLFTEFGTDGLPNHVGIYIGNSRLVHAKGVDYGVVEYGVGQFGSFRAARHPGMANVLGGAASNGGSPGIGGAFYGPQQNVTIPRTNYGVLAGTAAYGNLLYGHRYRVLVYNKNGETAMDVSQLKCTFSCVKSIMEANYSEVTIFNLSPETENKIIQEGYRVVIEAGYEGSQYGIIFDGFVIQPIRYKEGGTTYKLTLVSMDADTFMKSGAISFSLTRGQNSRAIIEHIANTATVSVELGSISAKLSDTQLTRGKVVFGKAADYLRQLAQSESATFYMEDGRVNIIKAEDYPINDDGGEIIDLTPQSGLIGVPEQQDYGATIKMLLNPRVKLGSFIHVDNSLIRNQQFQQGQVPYMLDQDGIYRVIKVTHEGDTRGNDWYTEAVTVTQSGADIPNMMPNANVNPFSG